MASIPKPLHAPINGAFPANTCLVATVQPDGFAQVTPRGSVLVFDDNTIAFWERGKGSTTSQLKDGSKVTIYFRDPNGYVIELAAKVPGHESAMDPQLSHARDILNDWQAKKPKAAKAA